MDSIILRIPSPGNFSNCGKLALVIYVCFGILNIAASPSVLIKNTTTKQPRNNQTPNENKANSTPNLLLRHPVFNFGDVAVEQKSYESQVQLLRNNSMLEDINVRKSIDTEKKINRNNQKTNQGTRSFKTTWDSEGNGILREKYYFKEKTIRPQRLEAASTGKNYRKLKGKAVHIYRTKKYENTDVSFVSTSTYIPNSNSISSVPKFGISAVQRRDER